MKIATIRLVLGDQLNHQHSWFKELDPSVLYVIAELKQETDYVKHHGQKVAAFFAAMEAFATELRQSGHHVDYLDLDDTAEFDSLPTLIEHLIRYYQAERFEYQRPDEYRLAQQLAHHQWSCESICVDSEHFLLPFEEIDQVFPLGKHVLMEHFYRGMRKRYDILMEEGKPQGGKWNFDARNRKSLKQKDLDQLPAPLMFSNDISHIKQRIERHHVTTIGELNEQLLWPVTRSQSLNLLAFFCLRCLPNFGSFQDAMTDQHDSAWSLYHSRLSFALNCKLISPFEVITTAVNTYQQRDDIDIAQIEGFVRQILGWREYVRGVYWANMPHYKTINALNAKRKLPSFFWTGDTRLNCVHQAVKQSLKYAYAHHIQRLMITGNFCLITEIDPDQVDAWYLGIYIDAIEWVEMPNTRGMALFADGGIVGTKPYAASGAYVNRMGDYCKSCHYNVKGKVEESACPLNSLYWRFMHTNRELIGNNPRIGMVYRSWDALDDEQQQQVLDRAEYWLANLESL
ncbi:cryptochrome/photolyase family protein [Vibrio ponticus]|uniref:Cryptochrome/photolyase family protein n=1 Tax=Vibrio ponticus TaxID=265668 RepID=A0A3N3E019_9VIBR|nr:cryptochrome/photolyase family protein [Vibrio ponticus]ROV60091.1 cryptochrome/photolyase family protein [Vibrio ponticus]